MFSDKQWKRIKASLAKNLIEQWQHYAPNMTPANVIGLHVAAPDDVEKLHPDNIEGGYSQGSTIASQMGRYRPAPGLSGYRTLLANVYNCSSNLHSGSGIGRGSSYNCFQVMAADLGLKMPAPTASKNETPARIGPSESHSPAAAALRRAD